MNDENGMSQADEKRRRFLAYLLAGGVAVPLAACTQESVNGDEAHDEDLHNSLLWAVAWTQTAAEFAAICHQAYNIAKLRIDMALGLHNDADKPLAVITDMDNTIIQTADYWGHLINAGHDFFDDALWDDWMSKNLVKAVPGSQAFFDHCLVNNVEVFYVSNRDQGDRTDEYALAQLENLNFPYADAEHLTANRATSNKMAIKEKVSLSHNLVLMLGDNLNDYKRDYYVTDIDERFALVERDRDEYGDRFILLPNPTDGHWVRAIFGESEPSPTDANRRLLKDAATRSSWDEQ